MHDIINIRFVDAKWDEKKDPRGSGKKGGQFVRKGESGSGAPNGRFATRNLPVHGAVRSSAGTLAESGKTPIGAFVASRLASGDSPEEIAEKLKAVTALHKNPQYINKMYRQIEKLHGLTPGVLGKPGAKTTTSLEPKPKKESVEPKEESAPILEVPYKPHGPKATHAELDALVKSRSTQREKGYHALAWRNATSDFVKLATSVAPLANGVLMLKNKSAHYDPDYGQGNHINMPYSDDTSEAALSTWRHEFAHNIDWARGKQYGVKGKKGYWHVNASYQLHDILVKEGTTLHKAYAARKENPSALYDKAKQKAVMDKHGLTEQEVDEFTGAANTGFGGFNKPALLGAIHNGVLADNITRCAHDGVANSRLHDFYGPMTKNKMGWGHSVNYYTKNPHFQTAEAFANYLALTQGKHGKIYKALLHATAPKLCAGFEKLLES